jgi:hypothetical protein
MANKAPELKEYVPLSRALKWIAKDPKYRWMPQQRLRAAVRTGEVPSKRSGPTKNARYYVRIRDLLKAVK